MSGNIVVLGLPYKRIFILKNETKTLTFGEYIIPHACVWRYSGLKYSVSLFAHRHEFSHARLGGLPITETIKIEAILGGRNLPAWVEEELEGLVTVQMILEAMYLLSFNLFESLRKIFEEYYKKEWKRMSTSLFAFLRFWAFIMQSIEKEDINLETIYYLKKILDEVYEISSATLTKKDGNVVPPSTVIAELLEKIEKMNLRVTRENLHQVLEELFQEKGWIVTNRILINMAYALGWASIITEKKQKRLRKIALRNFFETVFLVPIISHFSVDIRHFAVKKYSIINMVSNASKSMWWELSQNPYVQFVYEVNEKLITSARKLKNKGEKAFLDTLPEMTSDYLENLVKDFKSVNPTFYPPEIWQALAKNKMPLSERSIGDFLRDYDKRTFCNSIKELIIDALYYPKDCVQIVKQRAQKIYEFQKEDMRKLLGRTYSP